MKTVSTRLTRAVVVLGLVALPARAYEPTVTHPELTNFAFERSNLIQDPTLFQRIRLNPWDKFNVGFWLRFGAYNEDRFPRGSFHFFDPNNGQGLVMGYPPLTYTFTSSRTWVLENEGPIEIPPEQTESLADGREALTRALTFNAGAPADSEKERYRALADFFIDLGAAVHHLQDMAQPQHVRNDAHRDIYPLLFGYDPSLYEKYTKQRHDQVLSYGAMGSPVFPGMAGLTAARDFWANTSQTGIAQYTNSRFVSQKSNFRMWLGSASTGTYDNPKPGAPTPYTVEDLYQASGVAVPAQVQSLCGSPATGCTMMEYPASFGAFTTQKASTYSIFDQDLKIKGTYVTYPARGNTTPYSTERVFSVNRFNFDAIHEPLLSTAVSYSAGFINHFFRGKLKVEPPQPGPYAAVDHQPGQGFTSIKAKVTNATPNESLVNGNIVAIARFHLNNCYQADLSGEFQEDDAGNLIMPCPFYRSNEEHIRVSSSEPFSFNPDLGREYTFMFSNPIPLNATDLVLQVYYQGQVGGEEKSIALGVADLSEPTFVTVLNGTDMFELPTSPVGTFVYAKDIPDKIREYPYTTVDENHDLVPDVPVEGGEIAYQISVDGEKIGAVTIPQGRFARVVVLVKPTTFLLSLQSFGSGFSGGTSDYPKPSKIGQVDPSGNTFYVSTVGKVRKQALHYTGVISYRYYRTANAPLSTFDVSKEVDATTLLPVTMVTSLSAPLASPAPRPVASARERPAELERLRVEFPATPPVKRVARALSANLKSLVGPMEVSTPAEAQ